MTLIGIVFTFITQVFIILIITPIKLLVRLLQTINKTGYRLTINKQKKEAQILQIRHNELYHMGYDKEAKQELKKFKLKLQVSKSLYKVRQILISVTLVILNVIQWALATFSVFFGLAIGLLMTTALVTSVIIPSYISLTSTQDSSENTEVPTKQEEKEDKPIQTNSTAALAVKVFEDMAKEEMGDQNSGHVSVPLNDGAGKNYGKYSFTQLYEIAPPNGNGFIPWLKKNYPDLAKDLTAVPASVEFDAQWRALGAKKDKEFTEAQAMYLLGKVRTYADLLKKETGVDINNGEYTLGVWSIFVSMMNQRPAWREPYWSSYLRSNPNATSTEIIQNTAGKLKVQYNGVYADSIRNRYARQEKKALTMTELVQFD